MKSALVIISLVSTLAIFGGSYRLFASPPEKEIAVVNIPDKTKLLKATLLGKYIFVHDSSKMAKDAPCFYVYEYSEDPSGKPEVKPEKVVVSFHCLPIEKSKPDQIVLTYGMLAPDLFELREIQFAGSTEAHRVP
jgi:hypothetical protein